MKESTQLHHVAVHCDDKKKALFFYQDVLGLELAKTFSLSKELTENIFGLARSIDVLAFQNSGMYIEIFLTRYQKKPSCHHVGLTVENLKEFIVHCQNHDVVTYSVKKGGKTLWFIKDFSGNIFEIKQQ